MRNCALKACVLLVTSSCSHSGGDNELYGEWVIRDPWGAHEDVFSRINITFNSDGTYVETAKYKYDERTETFPNTLFKVSGNTITFRPSSDNEFSEQYIIVGNKLHLLGAGKIYERVHKSNTGPYFCIIVASLTSIALLAHRCKRRKAGQKRASMLEAIESKK
jgi:hypothetical protein